jgi:hypothetical protein
MAPLLTDQEESSCIGKSGFSYPATKSDESIDDCSIMQTTVKKPRNYPPLYKSE